MADQAPQGIEAIIRTYADQIAQQSIVGDPVTMSGSGNMYRIAEVARSDGKVLRKVLVRVPAGSGASGILSPTEGLRPVGEDHTDMFTDRSSLIGRSGVY